MDLKPDLCYFDSRAKIINEIVCSTELQACTSIWNNHFFV